ncbi:MAG: bifunctional serine/threonine-protein kinase/formylglycine-generating enzyme family protein [Planctomycetaceae bacterium]
MNQPSSSDPEKERRLNAVIAAYLKGKDAGKPVSQAALIRAYPDLSDSLRSYFEGEALMGEVAIVTPGYSPSELQETIRPGVQESDTASEFSPRMFGRYQLLRPLGEGAMGSVYLAKDTTLDRQVALKIPKQDGNHLAEFKVRFAREARAAAALRHPNICSVFDAGEIDGTSYITMEFIDGVPLSRFIGGDKLRSLSDVLGILRTIAQAIEHAHSKGVIHRDLKPGNILVTSEFVPLVTDFGLARLTNSSEDSRITEEGLLIGTPAYMAPEQVKGEQATVGRTSDIYSLGVIFFEMLTCRLPFEGRMPELLAKVLRDPPVAPGRLRNDLPEDVDDVCLKMLNKLPKHRYQSMSEVIQAIDHIQQKLSRNPPIDRPPTQQSSPFDIQKAHIEVMLKQGQYAAAIQELEKLATESAPAATAVCNWAKAKLPEVKAESKALSPAGIRALLQTGEQMYRRADYLGCVQLLEEVPALRRTEEIEDLIRRATKREADSEKLLTEIKDREGRQALDGLENLVQRFLKLKPGSNYARRLLVALQSYSKLPLSRRKYRWENGRLQAMPEPGFVKQWAIPAAVTFFAVFASVSSYVYFYLKNGTQQIAVHVDDEWLKEQGGELTLLVDGTTHTLTARSGTEEKLTLSVTLGAHTFSVRHGDAVVHDPRTFQIEQGGRNVVTITATDLRLTNGTHSAPADKAEQSDAVVMAHEANETAVATSVGASPPEGGDSQQARGSISCTFSNFSEIHGATWDQLQQWSASLKQQEFRWISVQANRLPVVYDAVACRTSQTDAWKIEKYRYDDESGVAGGIHGYRPAGMCVYPNDLAIEKLLYLIADGGQWGYWVGERDFISSRITEGLTASERVQGHPVKWLPTTLLANYVDGRIDYELLEGWLPFEKCEWASELSADNLQSQLTDFRSKNMRPHIVNAINFSPAPQYFAVAVDNPRNEPWAYSPRLTTFQYEQLLPKVNDRGGIPRCVVSSVEGYQVVYRVIWDHITESELATLAEQIPADQPAMAQSNKPDLVAVNPLPTVSAELANGIRAMKYSSQIDGASKSQLSAWANALPEQMRPHWISVRPSGSDVVFDAVASVSPDAGDWSLEFYDTTDPAHETKFGDDRFERTLSVYNVYRISGEYERLAVWTNGESLEWWHGNEGFVRDRIADRAKSPAGTSAEPTLQIPRSLRGYGQTFAVVFSWEPWRDSATFLRLNDDELAQKVNEYQAKGWRLHLVDSVRDSSSPASMAVFTDAEHVGRWEFSQLMTAEEYHQKLLDVDAQGGQARCVYSREEAGKIFYTAVWDFPTRPKAIPAAIADDDFQAVAPFNSIRARKYQQACAAHLKLPVDFTNSIGMTFRLIPPGKFTIGCSAKEIAAARPYLHTAYESDRPARCDSEGPQQVVTITKPFYLGTTEVTQQQFQTVVGRNPSSYSKNGSGSDMVKGEDRSQSPVENVTWIDTGEFCNRLSEHEKLEWAYRITPQLITQTGTGGYRLPTEAEWEFACRAGTTTRFSCGTTNLLLKKSAWFADNNSSGLPSNVGLLSPNPFGLYDMHGNVWEWVHDCWRPDTYQSWTGAAAVDPRTDTSSVDRRVIRGGDFFLSAEEARSGCRDCYSHDSSFHDLGFRVALSVDAVRQTLTSQK